MDLQDIKTRLQNGRGVSESELAWLICNDKSALAAFMVENNPGSVRDTLARIVQPPYTHLDFVPNKQQLAHQLEIILDRQDMDTWAKVINNFRLITTGLSPSFIEALKSQVA